MLVVELVIAVVEVVVDLMVCFCRLPVLSSKGQVVGRNALVQCLCVVDVLQGLKGLVLSCFFLHCFAFRAIVAVIRCCFVLVVGEVLHGVAVLRCTAVVDVVSL